MEREIKIVIADDHRMVRRAWEILLLERADFRVVGQASNGLKLIQMLPGIKTDIVLMDLDMPVMNGFEATEKIKNRFPWVKVIGLSMQKDYVYIEKMFALGANGYLTKNASEEELFEAIEKVNSGGKFISREVGEVLNERVLQKEDSGVSQYTNLTEREIEVIKFIMEGKTTGQIADILFLSTKTVESHRRNIFKKLQVKNVAQMISVVKGRII